MLFADPQLAARIERAESDAAASLVATIRRLDPAAEAEVMEVAGGRAVFLAPNMPVNRAIGLGMDQPVGAEAIDAVEAFYRRHACSPRIDLCPLADRSLVDALGPRGYAISRVFNAYVRGIGPAEPVTPVPDVTVAEAGPDDAEDWAQAVTQGFLGRDAVAEDDPALLLSRLTIVRPGVRAFLARIGGVPVGGAAMDLHDGLAVLYSASTRLGFRTRGVHRALLGARLAAAAAAGADHACLIGPPGSRTERAAGELGFRHAYTRMVMVREWR